MQKLIIPKTARIAWNTIEDLVVERDDQESIFLATFDDVPTNNRAKYQIDYSYYNRGKYAAAPKFMLHVYTCGVDFENYSDTINHFDEYYDNMLDAVDDINNWLAFFKHHKRIKSMHSDLQTMKHLVYDKLNLEFENLILHSEGEEYGACRFDINRQKIEHRVSKITPTKAGQFVTIWKRNEQGITAPFDVFDDIDFIIITSKKEGNLGQFIFPKTVLIEKGIISQNEKEGKRGIRVYPPWDEATNRQAEKTQNWQVNYFFTPENFINNCKYFS